MPRIAVLRLCALVTAAATSLALTTAVAAAADSETDANEPLRVATHGFASQGFLLSSSNNYLAHSREGSFEFSEVGLNFTASLSERLRAGMQLFSRKLGPIGDYSVKADWYYLDYRFADALGIRAGRTKIPFGLHNETSDVDAARVPILLPQSVYPTQNRDYLLAQTGVEAYGRLDMTSAGALEYRAYGGTIQIDATSSSLLVVQNLVWKYLVGGRVMWETPIERLRIGGSVQALRLDGAVTNPQTSKSATFELPAVLAVGSIEYAAHDLVLTAEYSRWFIKATSSDQTVFPNVTQVSERAYVMASYRVSPLFQPGAYYALYFPDVDHRSGVAGAQHDVAATLRFDLDPHWILKLEGHAMVGTAGLTSALNDNLPLDQLTRTWGLFLAKTTAYF